MPTRQVSQLLAFSFLVACLPLARLHASDTAAVDPVAAKPVANETSVASNNIINYRRYSPTFASSGQPTMAQLAQQKAGGVERIIYIAFSDHKGSLAREDRTVKQLGMDYLHIPVVWDAPTANDFALFAAAMNVAPEKNTLLHCQVNFRASAFAMLYRVLYQNISVAEAKRDMNSVWTPDATWTEFIRNTLKTQNVDPDCASCDWTPALR